MRAQRIYSPTQKQLTRSNIAEVLKAYAKEDAQGGILSNATTLNQTNTYHEVVISKKSRRICAKALV